MFRQRNWNPKKSFSLGFRLGLQKMDLTRSFQDAEGLHFSNGGWESLTSHKEGALGLEGDEWESVNINSHVVSQWPG